MKFFVVIIHYKVPVEQFEQLVPKHRAYLQQGYQKGLLLMSGPQNPRIGGIVIARAPALVDLQQYFSNDPYRLEGVAEHEFIEFTPVNHQDFMKDWIEGK